MLYEVITPEKSESSWLLITATRCSGMNCSAIWQRQTQTASRICFSSRTARKCSRRPWKGWFACSPKRLCRTVITSYSIHYTKLYESVLQNVRFHDHLRAGGEDFLFTFDVVARIKSFVQITDVVACHRYSKISRITSYNVCYTKLLRIRKQLV